MKMNTEFKVGDVVELISGGPKMTIGELIHIPLNENSTKAICYYFPRDAISDTGVKYTNWRLLEQCTIPLAALHLSSS